MAEESEKKSGNFVIEYFKSFGLLKETRKEYWGMQVVNFIDHTILFAIYTIAVLYFSAGTDKFGFGMSDTTAGYVYTIFASFTTICLFFTGLVSDWLGIRRSMLVNQGVLLFLRAAIVLVTFNQILFSGDLQLRVNDGQQLCVIDRSGADGVPEIAGTQGRGELIAQQLGLTNLQAFEPPRVDGEREPLEGAWYSGKILSKPELKPVASLSQVISRINDADGNELKGEKQKVRARLGKDKKSLWLVDQTKGNGTLTVESVGESTAMVDLGLVSPANEDNRIEGEPLFEAGTATQLKVLNNDQGIHSSDFETDLVITARDGTKIEVILGRKLVEIHRDTSLGKLREGNGIYPSDPDPAKRFSDLVDRINHADGNDGKVSASVEKISDTEQRLVLVDKTGGVQTFSVANADGSTAAGDLGLTGQAQEGKITSTIALAGGVKTKLSQIGNGVTGAENGVDLIVTASDGSSFGVELDGMEEDVIIVTTADGETYEVNLTGVDSVAALLAEFDNNSGGWGWLLMAILFVAQAPFLAIGQTAFQAANKRFTTPRSRSAGFNLWYLFMNVGAFFAGLLIDIVFIGFDLPRVHVLTVGVGTAVICLVCISTFIRREEQLVSPDEQDADAEGKQESEESADNGEIREIEPTIGGEEKPEKPRLAETPARMTPWQNFLAVASEPVFWRFTCLITLLIPVRAVFLYMHLLMPKFWTRVIGPDAYIGLLTAVNPALVIVGLILLIPILNKFSVYKMLTYGALVSGLSLFILAIPGTGDMAYYIAFVCLVVLTIGEVVWSPRLTEYTAAIAPSGQEGTYLGFSMVPYFLAKTCVSLASGHMLARWCDKPPEDNPLQLRESLEAGEIAFWDSPGAMWFVLAVPAVGGPILALLLKNWFTKGAHFKHGEHSE